MADRVKIGAKHLKSLTVYVHCGVLMEMKKKKYSYCFVVISKGANDICLYCFENQFSSKAQYVLNVKDFENTDYYECENEDTVGFKIMFQDVTKSPRIYICSNQKESLDWIMEINKAINNSYSITNNDSGFGSASSAGTNEILQIPEGPYSNVHTDASFSLIAPDHDLSVPEEHYYAPHSRSIRNTDESSASQLEQLDTRKPLPTPRHDARVNKSPKPGAGMPLASKSEGSISEDVVPDTSECIQLETHQHVSKQEAEMQHSEQAGLVLMRSNTEKRKTDRRNAQMLPEDPSTITDSGVEGEPVKMSDISSNNKRGSSGSSFESVRSGASDHDTVSDKTKDANAVESVDKGVHDGSR